MVFDCNVLLQAVLSANGPAFACLERAETGRVHLYLSTDILEELSAVLRRPELAARFPALSEAVVNRFLLHLRKIAATIPAVPRRVRFGRDPKDEPYLDLALHVRARYLVTRDQDLLELRLDDLSPASRRSRLVSLPFQTLDPFSFLREVA